MTVGQPLPTLSQEQRNLLLLQSCKPSGNAGCKGQPVAHFWPCKPLALLGCRGCRQQALAAEV